MKGFYVNAFISSVVTENCLRVREYTWRYESSGTAIQCCEAIVSVTTGRPARVARNGTCTITNQADKIRRLGEVDEARGSFGGFFTFILAMLFGETFLKEDALPIEHLLGDDISYLYFIGAASF